MKFTDFKKSLQNMAKLKKYLGTKVTN